MERTYRERTEGQKMKWELEQRKKAQRKQKTGGDIAALLKSQGKWQLWNVHLFY